MSLYLIIFSDRDLQETWTDVAAAASPHDAYAIWKRDVRESWSRDAPGFKQHGAQSVGIYLVDWRGEQNCIVSLTPGLLVTFVDQGNGHIVEAITNDSSLHTTQPG